MLDTEEAALLWPSCDAPSVLVVGVVARERPLSTLCTLPVKGLRDGLLGILCTQRETQMSDVRNQTVLLMLGAAYMQVNEGHPHDNSPFEHAHRW